MTSLHCAAFLKERRIGQKEVKHNEQKKKGGIGGHDRGYTLRETLNSYTLKNIKCPEFAHSCLECVTMTFALLDIIIIINNIISFKRKLWGS